MSAGESSDVGLEGANVGSVFPDWGVMPRWPQNGTQWLHEADVEIAQQLLPSWRVFCRRRWDGEFYWLHYGQIVLRTRPVLWNPVPALDLEIGQQVELLGKLGKNDAGVFRISDICFQAATQQFVFSLRRDEIVLEKTFLRSDLRPVYVQHHLRRAYFQHSEPRQAPDAGNETLDVGDLLGE